HRYAGRGLRALEGLVPGEVPARRERRLALRPLEDHAPHRRVARPRRGAGAGRGADRASGPRPLPPRGPKPPSPRLAALLPPPERTPRSAPRRGARTPAS